jgi:Cu2+-exporting ATPase
MSILSLFHRGTPLANSSEQGLYSHRQRRTPLMKIFVQPPSAPPETLQTLAKSWLAQITPEQLWPTTRQTALQTLLQEVDNRYQLVIHKTIDRLFGTHYEKHLQALSGTSAVDSIPPLVKARNRQAGFAGLAFVLALNGAPLSLAVSFAINLYLGYVVIQIGLQDMLEKRRLTTRGRNALFYLLVLFSGLLAVQSAMLVVSLFLEKLIATVQGQAHSRLANVFGELPQRVWLLRDGSVVDCALTEITAGDVVVVHAGEVIPVDGEIIAGHASVDQHALTGEAQPAEMEVGSSVLASTLVLMGELQVRANKTNADTMAAQITGILNNTLNYPTKTGLRGIEIADQIVYLTTGLGLLALPIWGLEVTLSIWVVPVGMILMATTPLNLIAYLDLSARSNILVKDGRSLDLLGDINTVVFDKTGTLTLEEPTVCAVHLCGEMDQPGLLALAAAVEQYQSHPIATAIRTAAKDMALALPTVDSTQVEIGYGLAVNVPDGQGQSRRVQLGSRRYMTLSDISIPADLAALADERQSQGHSLVYLAMKGLLQGAIELKPTVRPEAQTVVETLHRHGIEIAMITGDHAAPAHALATSLGIDRVFANILPEEKARLVQELQEQGRHVLFVGDGINDSIALKQANVSVSISGATTVATDTAQIVLMDGTLAQLNTLFELGRKYEVDLKKLIFLGVHLPAVHLAAILLFGWGLASTYAIGIVVTLANIGVAFRPIWQKEHLQTTISQTPDLKEPKMLQ